jgi:2-octaprenyl-6-methoxyphenol hydroxylase
MSLADITVLLDLCSDARATGADIGSRGLLARYNRARHPDILARVAGVDALNRAAMTASQPLRNLRRSGLRALKTIKPLHQGVMRAGLGAGRMNSDPKIGR